MRLSSVMAVLTAAGGMGVSGSALAEPVLFDNGEFVTHPGAGFEGADVSQTEVGIAIGLGNSAFASPPSGPLKIADDFTVSGAGARGWLLTHMTWYAFQTQTSPFHTDNVFTHVFVEIYDGSPMLGGTLIAGDLTTNRFLSGAWTGAYRVSSSGTALMDRERPIMALDVDMSWVPPLTDGTYYVSVSVGNANAMTRPVFGVPVTPQRPGDNAEQFFNGNWLATPIDFPFTLFGACPGDFNRSGEVSVQDIFDFLAAYFSSDPAADVNGVGGVTVQDIFDFLSGYFAACE